MLLGLVDIHLVVELANYLIKKDKAGALKFLNENIEKGMDIPEFTGTFIDYLRKLLILKIDSGLIGSVMPGETKEVEGNGPKTGGGIQRRKSEKALNLLLDADNKSKYASIQQLPLELAMIESIGIE